MELNSRLSRDLALFNLAINSKLRACDLVALKVNDVLTGSKPLNRGMVIQKKTGRPVQFELTVHTQEAVQEWVNKAFLQEKDYLFVSPIDRTRHITTRSYAAIVKKWVQGVGLDPSVYGTHSLRRTKATLIYRQTHNIRAVQILLGHNKIESTVKYLGVEVDDALAISEHIDA